MSSALIIFFEMRKIWTKKFVTILSSRTGQSEITSASDPGPRDTKFLHPFLAPVSLVGKEKNIAAAGALPSNLGSRVSAGLSGCFKFNHVWSISNK